MIESTGIAKLIIDRTKQTSRSLFLKLLYTLLVNFEEIITAFAFFELLDFLLKVDSWHGQMINSKTEAGRTCFLRENLVDVNSAV